MSFDVEMVLDLKIQPRWCSFVSWLLPLLQKPKIKLKTKAEVRKLEEEKEEIK